MNEFLDLYQDLLVLTLYFLPGGLTIKYPGDIFYYYSQQQNKEAKYLLRENPLEAAAAAAALALPTQQQIHGIKLPIIATLLFYLP